jgi:aryl-alcohol dehydrogenase-like predicted oxidoreductase
VLAALDAFAARHAVPPAAVALACLTAQPTVAAAVASARTIEQLHDLLAAARLKLSADDVELVGGVSAP